LVDTSILARLPNTADPFHAVAVHAVLELHRRGDVLHITPQNLIEFRNTATRPKGVERMAGISAVGPQIGTRSDTFSAATMTAIDDCLKDALGIP
jgi:hypothetical protein